MFKKKIMFFIVTIDRSIFSPAAWQLNGHVGGEGNNNDIIQVGRFEYTSQCICTSEFFFLYFTAKCLLFTFIHYLNLCILISIICMRLSNVQIPKQTIYTNVWVL